MAPSSNGKDNGFSTRERGFNSLRRCSRLVSSGAVVQREDTCLAHRKWGFDSPGSHCVSVSMRVWCIGRIPERHSEGAGSTPATRSLSAEAVGRPLGYEPGGRGSIPRADAVSRGSGVDGARACLNNRRTRFDSGGPRLPSGIIVQWEDTDLARRLWGFESLWFHCLSLGAGVV